MLRIKGHICGGYIIGAHGGYYHQYMEYMDIIASVYGADDETSSTLVMTPFHFHLTHIVVASIYQTYYIFSSS